MFLSIFLLSLQLFACSDLFLCVCVCFDFFLLCFFCPEAPWVQIRLSQTQSVLHGCLQPVMLFPGWGSRQCPCIALLAGLCLAGISQMKNHSLSFILNPRDLVWLFFPLRGKLNKPSMYLNSKMVIIFLHRYG